MKNILFFIVPLVCAFIIFRTILYIISRPITQMATHTREGAKFHHLHYGLVIMLVGFFTLLTQPNTSLPLLILGFGYGMVLDEFIPSLYLPEPEPFTTLLYRNSFRRTAIMIGIIALVALSMGFLVYYK